MFGRTSAWIALLLAAIMAFAACREAAPARRAPRRRVSKARVEPPPPPAPTRHTITAPECSEAVYERLEPVTGAELCRRYAEAGCRARLDADCCLGAPRLYDADLVRQCTEDRERACATYTESAAVREGRLRLDGVSAAKYLREYECRAFRCERGVDLFEYAHEFFVGDSVENMACGDGLERLVCAAGFVCKRDQATQRRDAATPKCVRQLAAGDRCTTRHDACRRGTYCEPTLKNEQGEPDMTNALNFDLPGRCVRARVSGAECFPRAEDGGDHYCRSGLCVESVCVDALPITDTYCRAQVTPGF